MEGSSHRSDVTFEERFQAATSAWDECLKCWAVGVFEVMRSPSAEGQAAFDAAQVRGLQLHGVANQLVSNLREEIERVDGDIVVDASVDVSTLPSAGDLDAFRRASDISIAFAKKREASLVVAGLCNKRAFFRCAERYTEHFMRYASLEFGDDNILRVERDPNNR